jgi:hypothetical protein
MCNLYSITKPQQAIRDLVRAIYVHDQAMIADCAGRPRNSVLVE